MKATLNQDFKIIQDESGGSLQQQRVLEEENAKEETINEIRAGQQFVSEDLLGEEFVQSASIDNDDDETALVRIITAIDTGSEQDIQNALQGALTDISSTIARDKTKTRKQLEKLDEIISVLEVTSRLSKINTEIDSQLAGQRQQISQAIKAGDIGRSVELLNNSQLRASLELSAKNSRVQSDVLQPAIREAQLKTQLDLREAFKQTEAIYKLIKSQAAIETNPAIAATLRQALTEVAKQAQAIRDVVIQQNRVQASQQTTSQAMIQQTEMVRSLQQTLTASQQALKTLPVNVETRTALSQMIDSRLDAVRNVQSKQGELQTLNRISEISRNPASLKSPETVNQGLPKELRSNPIAQNLESIRATQKGVEIANQPLPKELRSNPEIKNPELLKPSQKDIPPQIKEPVKDSKALQPEIVKSGIREEKPNDKIIKPDPEVFRGKPSIKPEQSKPSPIDISSKAKESPKEPKSLQPEMVKPSPKQEKHDDKIIRPDPEVFRGNPPTKPEKVHVCRGNCCGSEGKPVDNKPANKPDEHVHGSGCGCGPKVVAFQTSSQQVNTNVKANEQGRVADAAAFDVAI